MSADYNMPDNCRAEDCEGPEMENCHKCGEPQNDDQIHDVDGVKLCNDCCDECEECKEHFLRRHLINGLCLDCRHNRAIEEEQEQSSEDTEKNE